MVSKNSNRNRQYGVFAFVLTECACGTMNQSFRAPEKGIKSVEPENVKKIFSFKALGNFNKEHLNILCM